MKNLLLIALTVIAFNLNAQSINLKASVQSPICNGDATGAIDVLIDGGTAPYTIEWYNAETQTLIPGQTSSSISSLLAGKYAIVVSDNVGLSTVMKIVIGQPDALVLAAFALGTSGPGANDGSINLTVRGGTHDYFFAWDNGATSEDISGLSAGDYTVVVTDGYGCQKSVTRTVSDVSMISNGGNNNNQGIKAPNTNAGGNNMTTSMFPNPASDFLRVNTKGDAQISVVNVNGQEVIAKNLTSENSMLDVTNLPAGNYLVTVKTATETTTKNITIAK